MNTKNLENTLLANACMDACKVRFNQLLSIRESGLRPNTCGVNHALMQQLTDFFGAALYVQDVTEDFCVAFARFLRQRVSDSSARTYLHKLHAVLEQSVGCHLISHNPMPSMKQLIPGFRAPQRTYLTHKELRLLEQAPCRHPETKRAFLFACQTGLRLSDIETLRWEDIKTVEGKPTIIKNQVKTQREVRVPLNTIALQLVGVSRGNGLIFNMMSRSVITTDLRQWAAEAGIDKHLTFHVSRHTFATLSISAGVNIYVVSKLCGHSSVRTTEIYAHMIDKTLQQGVNMLCSAMEENGYKSAKKSKFFANISALWFVEKVFGRRKNRAVDIL